MADSSFQDLARSIVDEVLSWDPSFATQLGWHKYDKMLPDPTVAAVKRQVERLSEFVSTLKRVDPSSLSGDQELDRELAIHYFSTRLFELTELRMHEKLSQASAEIGDSLFFIFVRDHPPFEQRLDSIIHRLEAVPEFIELSKPTVKTPYRIWNEIMYETGERLPHFLRDIEAISAAKSKDREAMARLRKAVRQAIESIQENNQWIASDVLPRSQNKYSIGPQLYRKYLAAKGYGVTPAETVELAEVHLDDTNKKKAEVAKKIVSSGNPNDALLKMRGDHAPTFEGVLKEYRESAAKAKQFVIEKGLVTVPDNEKLHILETPVFMRHLVPYAAQYEPGKFDGDRNGMFLVTPDEGNPSSLEDHSRVAIQNTTVHEAYPGHHLHGICANENPSYIRLLHGSPDFAEGWGLYTEDMMISEGYNDTHLGRLTTLNDLAFRLARQIADVKLSMNMMSLEGAADLLVKETGTDTRAAKAEAKAMALSPTYYVSYFIGKLGVLQMREDLEAVMGGRFSLKFFHDSLIYSGCMPNSFMRKALALKLKEKHGMTLGLPKESLFDFGMRRL